MKKSIYKSKFITLFMTIIFVIPLFVSCDQTVDVGYILIDQFKLTSHPGNTPTIQAAKGLSNLNIGNPRDGFIYIPSSYTLEKEFPLAVFLHGAGGSANNWSSFVSWAEEKNVVIIAIDSRSVTWDFVGGNYGPDVVFLDKTLKYTFERCKINPEKIALAGFSDGASYALSLGATNGNVFSHLIAYSPGFYERKDPLDGTPKIFISHGVNDSVLPSYISKNNIVPTFISFGYDVTYEEFMGGHEVPENIINLSLNDWFLESDTK